jgi:excinuclease ABC subunit C
MKLTLTELYQETTFFKTNKGNIHTIFELAYKNAHNYLAKNAAKASPLLLLDALRDLLHLKSLGRIDLFDNSHLSGDYPVGVSVSYVNGVPYKKLYRKFNAREADGRDDLLNMKENVWRRYHHETSDYPDLILVDGAVNQVHAAMHALEDLSLTIPVFGLYKNEKHQTKGLVDQNGREILIENREILFFLTRMQDEVHRFAITFHRRKKSQSLLTSRLSGIKGVGVKTLKKLQEKYHDIEVIKSLTLSELEENFPKNVAQNIFDFFN